MLEAAGAYIEPNQWYPDPFEDLEDEIFEEYIKYIKEKRELDRKIIDIIHGKMALMDKVDPSMEQ